MKQNKRTLTTISFVLVLFTLSIGIFVSCEKETPNQQLEQTLQSTVPDEIRLFEEQFAQVEKDTVTLSDGSVIVQAKGYEFSISRDQNVDERRPGCIYYPNIGTYYCVWQLL